MCVYSAYVQQIGEVYPGLLPPPPPQPFNPFYPPLANPTYAPTDPELLKEIRALGKRLDAIDKALGLKDCSQEEAAKRAFEEKIDKLIADAAALKKSVQCEDDQCQIKQPK
jgi:hypothetical protein